MSDWTPTDRTLPEEGVVVNVGGRWFFLDHSMYVYFVPRYWQAVSS